ncbi:MAG TPA: hypothetical protein VMR41_06510 [Patescibacteria group bacterium]|nr:hypothetical protein [Patescibacteria group bacterium]
MERRAYIKITSIPPGEAPEHIRQSWVGLTLPLEKGYEGPIEVELGGSVTGKYRGRRSVYPVLPWEALDVLGKENTEAAVYWGSRGFYSDNNTFYFDATCAEIVSPPEDRQLNQVFKALIQGVRAKVDGGQISVPEEFDGELANRLADFTRVWAENYPGNQAEIDNAQQNLLDWVHSATK